MSSYAASGQIVVGPPGAGKTTYCAGMREFLTGLGRRVIIVNLDPANDSRALPYRCEVNVLELIRASECADSLMLGPNGALIYCLDFLAANMEWLAERLRPFLAEHCYVLFDFPGQIETFTHSDVVARIVAALASMGLRLCCVNLVDSQFCVDGAKFLSAALVSLLTMTRLELPHVNVLTKVDLLRSYGPLACSLEFFAEGMDMARLARMVTGGDDAASPRSGGGDSGDAEGSDDAAGTPPPAPAPAPIRPRLFRRYKALTEALAELLEDYNLINFQLLCITDADTLARLVCILDKTVGYVPGGEETVVEGLDSDATLQDIVDKYSRPLGPSTDE